MEEIPLEEVLVEGIEEELRCTMQFVMSAVMTVKFLLGQVEINQYTAVIVLKEKPLEIETDHLEEVEDETLEEIETTEDLRLVLVLMLRALRS